MGLLCLAWQANGWLCKTEANILSSAINCSRTLSEGITLRGLACESCDRKIGEPGAPPNFVTYSRIHKISEIYFAPERHYSITHVTVEKQHDWQRYMYHHDLVIDCAGSRCWDTCLFSFAILRYVLIDSGWDLRYNGSGAVSHTPFGEDRPYSTMLY